MGKIVNIIGKKFGRWSILSLHKIGSHGKEYLCKCDCGNKKVIRGSSLTSRASLSCGCLIGKHNKGKLYPRNANSKIGEKFNKLLIIGITHNIKKHGGYLMICKCDCGNETKQFYSDLKNEIVKSCGCYQREVASITGSMVGLNNGTKNCGKHNWHFIQNEKIIKMRSGYEVMYAIILENRGVEWQYEPKLFKLQNGMRYTPDFYLPQTNEWIDVKGRLTEKHKLKHQIFQEMGNKLTLIFIEDIQRELTYSYAKFKKDWDSNHRNWKAL